MRLRTLFAAIGLALSAPTAAFAQTAAQDTGERISVEVRGSGPDVILIPGLASSRDVWSDIADRLDDDFRVHLVQLGGFAGSPPPALTDGKVVAPAAEAIAAYIRREKLERPAVIGHSLGGAMALMLGARHPHLAGRLMVVDALPFYALSMSPQATAEAIAPQAAQFRDATLAAPAGQYEAMQTASIARMTRSEAARPALVAAGLASDRATVANAVHELLVTDLRSELGAITAPLTVIYAYHPDYGVPGEQIDALYRSAYAEADDARLERVNDSFHFIMLDQPDRFASLVAEFLAGRPAGE